MAHDDGCRDAAGFNTVEPHDYGGFEIEVYGRCYKCGGGPNERDDPLTFWDKHWWCDPCLAHWRDRVNPDLKEMERRDRELVHFLRKMDNILG